MFVYLKPNSVFLQVILWFQITLTIIRKLNLFRLTVQNNAIRTNYIKAKIDNTQQNSKCRFCCDRDETINYIIKERAKKFKTRHDWVGKEIICKLCKTFDYTTQ